MINLLENIGCAAVLLGTLNFIFLYRASNKVFRLIEGLYPDDAAGLGISSGGKVVDAKNQKRCIQFARTHINDQVAKDGGLARATLILLLHSRVHWALFFVVMAIGFAVVRRGILKG